MHNPIPQGFALSPQQQQLWRVQPDSRRAAACQATATVDVEGSLDLDTLEQAVQRVVQTHEILRTSFHCLKGAEVLLQRIAETGEAVFETYQLEGVDADGREAELESIRRRLEGDVVDLEHGRPLRVAVLRLSPRLHRLLIVMPALCADVVALDNLVREIAAGYGSGSSSPEEILQYADLAEWQNELLRGEDTAAGREHWTSQDLSDAVSCRLPMQMAAPVEGAFSSRRQHLPLGARAAAKVFDLATESGESIHDVLLSCWVTLLWRWTGRESICLGVAHDGRRHDELANALGPFVRYLPLHLKAETGLSWRLLLERAGEVTRAAQAMQEFFSWDLVEEQLEVAWAPFHPIAFDCRRTADPIEVSGLTFHVRESRATLDRSYLELGVVHDGAGALAAELRYDPEAFSDATIERLGRQLLALVSHALEAPDLPIDRLEILDQAEQARILFGFNAAPNLEVEDARLHELVRRQAASRPRAVALVDGDREWLYSELTERVDQLATHLRRTGVGPGALVALCLERSADMIAAMLAVLEAGAAYVPLDPTYPHDRLTFVLDDTQSRWLLSERRTSSRLPELADIEVVLIDEPVAPAAAGEPEPSSARPRADDLAYVIYTSGSTGRPKGVMVSHRSAVASTLARLAYYGPPVGNSFLLLSSYAFDSSVAGIYGTLCGGGTLVIGDEELPTEPERLARLIARRQVGALLTLPSLYGLLLKQEDAQLGSLKTAIVAGEACSTELVRRHLERLPECGLFNEYGPTEATVWSTVYNGRDLGDAQQMPIGRPIAGTRIYILDRHLQPVPRGVAAELVLGGAGLTRGYWNRPALTAARFVPHPFSEQPGERLYRSGDLASFAADGNVEFLGRVDQQVKIRGFRIELGEIEAALAAAPAVDQSVVVAVTEGDGPSRLVAYVATGEAVSPTIEELRGFLEHRLPHYMVPSAFVPLRSLPLMPNGKVDRRALPSPDTARLASKVAYVAPSSPVEERLATIWSGVLGIERIGRDDRFFSIGGDSILAIQAASKAGQAGLSMTPRQLFQHQTIAELATVVGEGVGAVAEQGPVTGAVPLTPIQHWFFDRQLIDPHHWNQALLFEVAEGLSAPLLEATLRQLLVHHDALRMRFENGPEGWRQVCAAPGDDTPLGEVDLSRLAAEDRASALVVASTSTQASLDLSSGPLLRAVSFRWRHDGTASRLLIALHHLVVDGVSWRILIEDLVRVYRQVSLDDSVDLPPKTSSFQQWAERLSAAALGGELEDEREYWRLAMESEGAALPLDRPGGRRLVAHAASVTVELDPEDTASLLQQATETFRAHIDEVLLTALGRSLTPWIGGSRLLVDLEGHGREDRFPELDVSRTVGWFTTTYPLALDLAAATTLEDALRAVKEQLRHIPGRGFGFGLLRYLDPDAAGAREPRRAVRPEISFNYLGQFGQVLPESSPFRLAVESHGAERSPRGERSHLLQINGKVVGGRLTFDWTYDQESHDRSTIERLAAAFASELRALAASSRLGDTEAATPSDFPLADVDQDELSQLSDVLEGLTELSSMEP
ncbi:MAG: amino acid adenylation domain-containing protein [Acidobacteriota bacterium]